MKGSICRIIFISLCTVIFSDFKLNASDFVLSQINLDTISVITEDTITVEDTIIVKNENVTEALKADSMYKCFIYTFSGDIIPAKKIKLDHNKEIFLVDDTMKINVKQVKFYKNFNGYYAYFLMGTYPIYCKRYIKGKINYFEYTQNSYSRKVGSTYSGNNFNNFGSNKFNKTESFKIVYYYYNKGFGDLESASYENLKVALCSNQKSLDKLETFKKSKRYIDITGYSSIGLAAAGLSLYFYRKIHETSGKNYNFLDVKLVIGTAIISGITTLIIQALQPVFRKKAIKIYNQK